MFLVSMKRQNWNKTIFVTKFVGIIVTQCFFTDHLKHKTVNKKVPSTYPGQLCTH